MKLDSNYPGGNIKVLSVDDDAGIVNIAPDLRDTEGHWFHFNFKVTGAEGRVIQFRFPQDGFPYLSTLGPAICSDGVNWRWLHPDGTRHDPFNAFTYSFGADETCVQFSMAIPYLQKDWETFTSKWSNSPEVKFDVLCKSQSGKRDVELLRVPCRGNSDFLFVFTARHHACEATGNPPMEGILSELMSGSSEGTWAREHADCVFVPFIDKDGVEDGDQGKNRRPWDHNRDYAKEHYTTVKALKQLIVRESEGKKIVFFDLHSPYIRTMGKDLEQEHVFTFGTAYENLNATWERFRENWKITQSGGKLCYDGKYDIKAKQGYWNVMKAAWDSGLLGSDPWVRTLPNTALATCCEFGYSLCGGVTSREGLRELGSNLFKAIVRTVG